MFHKKAPLAALTDQLERIAEAMRQANKQAERDTGVQAALAELTRGGNPIVLNSEPFRAAQRAYLHVLDAAFASPFVAMTATDAVKAAATAQPK